MFKKILDRIKSEIQLTREYYQNLAPLEPSIVLSCDKSVDNDMESVASVDRILVKRMYEDAKHLDTDLVIMSAHGASCPECAKYQGRVFSLSGHSKLFPKLPSKVSIYGGIHPGCGHTFSPYIHGVSDPMLDYTLTFQTDVAPRYRKNIIAFSGRPFVDDRLPKDIAKAEEYNAKLKEEQVRRLYFERHRAEIEAQWAADKCDYKWLQENLPDICPKSYSGYKRMKNGNTKNYQIIVAKAKEMGREIL